MSGMSTLPVSKGRDDRDITRFPKDSTDEKTKEVTAVLGLLPESTRLLFLRQLADAVAGTHVPIDVSPTRPAKHRNPHHVWNSPRVADKRASLARQMDAPVKSRPFTPTSDDSDFPRQPLQPFVPGGTNTMHHVKEVVAPGRSQSGGKDRPGNRGLPLTPSSSPAAAFRENATTASSSSVDDKLWTYSVRHTRGCICCQVPAEKEDGSSSLMVDQSPRSALITRSLTPELSRSSTSKLARAGEKENKPRNSKAQVLRVLRRWQKELVPTGLSEEEARKINATIGKAVRDLTSLKRINEKLGDRFAVEHSKLCVLRCFFEWRLTTQKTQVDKKQEENQLLVAVTERLAEETDGLAVKHLRLKAMWRAWLSWRGAQVMTPSKRSMAKHLLAMVRKQRTKKIRRAFELWAANAHYLASLKRLLERAFNKSRLRTLRRVVAAWRVWFAKERAQQKKLRTLMARVKYRRSAAAFATWIDFVDTERERRTYIGRVISRFRHAALAQAFGKWVADTEKSRLQKQKLKYILRRLFNHNLTAAFNRWVEYVSEEKRFRLLYKRAARKLRALTLSRAFNAWQEQVRKASCAKRVAHTIVKRMQNQTVATAMSTWVERVRGNKHKRFILMRAVKRITTLQIATAFSAWVDYVRRINRARRMALKAIAHMSMQTLQRAFLAWRMALVMTPEQSEAGSSEAGSRRSTVASSFDDGERLERAAVYWAHRRIYSTFQAWREYASYKVTLTVAMAKIGARQRYRVQGQAFHALKEWMFRSRARQQSILLTFLTRRLSKDSAGVFMERWKVATLVGMNRKLRHSLAMTQEECSRWENVHFAHLKASDAKIASMITEDEASAMRAMCDARTAEQEALAQRYSKLVMRLVTVVWYQGQTARVFMAWRLHVSRAQRSRAQDAIESAQRGLTLMVRELHAESANRRVLEDSMGRIVTERLGDAANTRRMLEEFEVQFHEMKKFIKPPLADYGSTTLSTMTTTTTSSL